MNPAAFVDLSGRRLFVKRAVFLLFPAAFLTSCATPPRGRTDLLDFIQDGQTTREETYLHLGEPTGLYEAGKIMSFRLDQDEGGYFLVERSTGFSGVKTNLIMVFDERGVLKKHALVQVKKP